MKRTTVYLRGMIILGLVSALSACGKDVADDADKKIVTANELPEATLSSDSANDVLAAVVGASEIPYPVYPGGTKYRVGGENGLKIVVFQTDDPFHKVDDYYNGLSDNSGMPRLMAMSDYVRYSNSTEDLDPWATHLPGIVIHEFEDDEDRQAVGASAMARTNIIMSF